MLEEMGVGKQLKFHDTRGTHDTAVTLEPSDSVTGGNHLEAHAGRAAVEEPQLLCGGLGEVDHPAFDVWTAVVDAHHDRSPVIEVRYLDPGAERQSPMRRSQCMHVEALAVRGAPALVSVRIVGCDPRIGARLAVCLTRAGAVRRRYE